MATSCQVSYKSAKCCPPAFAGMTNRSRGTPKIVQKILQQIVGVFQRVIKADLSFSFFVIKVHFNLQKHHSASKTRFKASNSYRNFV